MTGTEANRYVEYNEKCSVLNCFYNYNGDCCSVSDLHNPELKEYCIDYISEEVE